RILYRANLNTKQALQELEKSFGDVPEARELIEFIETSERGIIR
ncbi:MAG: acyl-[acyl-carrier-protein]--UDP-N-acetylglucosamine O-acyltransferase, partial [Verrucomicrobia bacterium]|nr:acyl-[acyl-carrier-protein]--UDP-N-acetylglucosamine O-acyltransferase [Verrucomicrobiota bacterium]